MFESSAYCVVTTLDADTLALLSTLTRMMSAMLGIFKQSWPRDSGMKGDQPGAGAGALHGVILEAQRFVHHPATDRGIFSENY
jgi:hypothetical protein